MILESHIVKYSAIGIAVTVVPVVAALSEGMLTAVLVAIPAILTVLGVIIVNVITALKKDVAEVKVTAGNIEGHVNSAASAAEAKILGLENEIKLMRTSLEDGVRAAALLAQSRAIEVLTSTQPAPVVVTNPEPVPVTVKKP